MLLKAQGKPIDNHPVIDHLCEQRVVLEKVNYFNSAPFQFLTRNLTFLFPFISSSLINPDPTTRKQATISIRQTHPYLQTRRRQNLSFDL